MDLPYMLFPSLLLHDYVKYLFDLKKKKILVSVTWLFVIWKFPEEIQCLRSLESLYVRLKMKNVFSIFSSSIFILHPKVNSSSLGLGLLRHLPCRCWWLGLIPTLLDCWMCGEYHSEDTCLCVWAPATMWVNFSMFFLKKNPESHFH